MVVVFVVIAVMIVIVIVIVTPTPMVPVFYISRVPSVPRNLAGKVGRPDRPLVRAFTLDEGRVRLTSA